MSFSENGFEVVDRLLPLETLHAMIEEVALLDEADGVGGIRNAEKQLKTVASLIDHQPQQYI